MSVKVTVLCENMTGRLGYGEHGFAAFIETPAENLLFDTGGGRHLADNAAIFKKDLRSVKKIVLSHGHDDHAGGLALALRSIGGPVDIYAHPGAFQKRWLLAESGKRSFKGIPFRQEYLEALGGRFIFDDKPREILDGVWISGEVPRTTAFETPDPRQQIQENGAYVTDPFLDDQSLFIATPNGLIILFGCAHAGMINIIRHARQVTGENRLAALIGGTHLGFLGQERMKASIEELRSYSPQFVACSHCTGLDGAFLLKSNFGEQFQYGRVGFEYCG